MRRIGRRAWIAVACVAIVTGLAATSHAFWSNSPDLHGAITAGTLSHFFTQENGKKTLEKIVAGNTGQDGYFSPEKELKKAHFDSETFEDTLALMVTRLMTRSTNSPLATRNRRSRTSVRCCMPCRTSTPIRTGSRTICCPARSLLHPTRSRSTPAS